MSPVLLSMVPITIVDIVGSALMITFSLFCVRHALALKRIEPQNVIWTYLLWFCSGLLVFSISRSGGHLIKHILIATHNAQAWYAIRPVSGSLNTISFAIVGAITLFFSKVYNIYRHMQEDKAAIECAHDEITKLNVNLEKIVYERTKDLSISEEKYRRLFENSKDILFICEENGDILDINDTGVDLLGFKDRHEALGRNFFMEFIINPKAESIKNNFEKNEFFKDMEVILKNRRGEELTVLFSATARKGTDGQQAGLEGTMKDITARKNMERQLLQADKMASLGQLSAGVAHEINNPLGLILGYTKLVLKEVEAGTQTYEDMKIIEKHSINCKKIVEDLLKFSRSTETTKALSNLNELLNDVFSVVENKFKLENVQVIKEFAHDLPLATVDPDKMKQVFMNVIMNARQAINGSGIITVSASLTPERDKILISFSDTGSGIPDSILHKIFDPFFTTKPTGMGTGLGLSVSYGIIKDHDGDIQVESAVGKGSTFKIYLPLPRGVS